MGQSDVAFDRKVLEWLAAGDHDALCRLTVKELHLTGEHELLNWMVVVGAVSPAKALTRFFGELGGALHLLMSIPDVSQMGGPDMAPHTPHGS